MEPVNDDWEPIEISPDTFRSRHIAYSLRHLAPSIQSHPPDTEVHKRRRRCSVHHDEISRYVHRNPVSNNLWGKPRNTAIHPCMPPDRNGFQGGEACASTRRAREWLSASMGVRSPLPPTRQNRDQEICGEQHRTHQSLGDPIRLFAAHQGRHTLQFGRGKYGQRRNPQNAVE